MIPMSGIWYPRAVGIRYRVARVMGVVPEMTFLEGTPKEFTSEEHAFVGDWREYKDHQRANAYHERLAKQGHVSILQHGIVEWLPIEEWESKWNAAMARVDYRTE